MKKFSLKKISVIAGIFLIIAVLLLTYLSSTIDNMLIPHVKVTEVISITTENPNDRFMKIPLSALSGFDGGVYFVRENENGKHYVTELSVNIVEEDELYYTVTSNDMFGGMDIVYFASKDIANGDRVYVEE